MKKTISVSRFWRRILKRRSGNLLFAVLFDGFLMRLIHNTDGDDVGYGFHGSLKWWGSTLESSGLASPNPYPTSAALKKVEDCSTA